MKFLISSLLVALAFSSLALTFAKSGSKIMKMSLSTNKKVQEKTKHRKAIDDDGMLKAPPQRKYKILARDKLSGIINTYDADMSYSDAGIWLIIYDSPKEIRSILMDANDVVKVAEQAEGEEKLAKKLEEIAFNLSPNSRAPGQREYQSDASKLKEEFQKNSDEHQFLIPFRLVKDCEYKLLGPDNDRKSNSIYFQAVNENMNFNFINGRVIGLYHLEIEIWVDDEWVDYSEIKEDNINVLAKSCTENREQLKAAATLYMQKYGYRKDTADKERQINRKIRELEGMWKMMGEKVKKYRQLFSSYGFAPAKIEEELEKINELKEGEPTKNVAFTYLKQLTVYEEAAT